MKKKPRDDGLVQEVGMVMGGFAWLEKFDSCLGLLQKA
jgi:hypothetical protein